LDAYVIFSYGIRIGELRILSPTSAMIIVGVMASGLERFGQAADGLRRLGTKSSQTLR
jgi:hypothetical protein